jgi:hypothetical protein
MLPLLLPLLLLPMLLLPLLLCTPAAAGALSGAISRFLVGPLDVVKIRFQVGVWCALISCCVQSCVAVPAVASSHSAFLQRRHWYTATDTHPAPPNPHHTQVQLEPIALHRGKAASHYHGFLHAFRTIVAEEGIKVGEVHHKHPAWGCVTRSLLTPVQPSLLFHSCARQEANTER